MLREYRGEHLYGSSMGLCGCGLYVGAAGVDDVVGFVRAIKTAAARTHNAAGTTAAVSNNIKEVLSSKQRSSNLHDVQ